MISFRQPQIASASRFGISHLRKLKRKETLTNQGQGMELGNVSFTHSCLWFHPCHARHLRICGDLCTLLKGKFKPVKEERLRQGVWRAKLAKFTWTHPTGAAYLHCASLHPRLEPKGRETEKVQLFQLNKVLSFWNSKIFMAHNETVVRLINLWQRTSVEWALC